MFAILGVIVQEVMHRLLGKVQGLDDALAKRLAPTRSLAAFEAYLSGGCEHCGIPMAKPASTRRG